MSVLKLSNEASIESNKAIYNDFDPNFSEQIVKNVFNLINDVFYRTQFIHLEQPIQRNNPDAPVILISNHSGRALPWDAVAFMSGLLRQFDYDHDKVCRTIIAPLLSSVSIMTPYFIPNFWKKCGGVDANFLNFETMMHYQKSNVLIFPEGVPGIEKGFNKRYQLQRFSTSFVRMSLKYNTDIVPISTVNAEYINPYMYNIPSVNKLAKRLIGLPFLPLGLLTIMLIFQPWFVYFSFPARLTFVKGKRIRRSELTDKDYSELSQEEIESICAQVRTQAQEELNNAVKQYGKDPYEWKDFFQKAWANRKAFPYFLPPAWTFLFSEFYCQFRETGKADVQFGWKLFFRLCWKRPLVLTYFIPILGWLPIIYHSMKGSHKEAPAQ